MPAEMVRQDIRQKLHAFHNAVNARLGKPEPPLMALGPMDRSQLYQQMRDDFEFLKTTWPAIHIEWKKATSLLISLVQSGTYNCPGCV